MEGAWSPSVTPLGSRPAPTASSHLTAHSAAYCKLLGESVAGTVAEGGEFVAGKASEWTAPARHAVAAGAQDFVKAASDHTIGVCLGASAGYIFGVNGEGCIDGNLRGVGVTGP